MTCTSSSFSPSRRRRSSNDRPFTAATFCAGNSSRSRSPESLHPIDRRPSRLQAPASGSFAETGTRFPFRLCAGFAPNEVNTVAAVVLPSQPCNPPGPKPETTNLTPRSAPRQNVGTTDCGPSTIHRSDYARTSRQETVLALSPSHALLDSRHMVTTNARRCTHPPLRLLWPCILCFSSMVTNVPWASAESVVEVPMLAAIHANNLGARSTLATLGSPTVPSPIVLQWQGGNIKQGPTNLGSMITAFQYAIEHTPTIDHTGTVNRVIGIAYAATGTDGPSAGGVMTVWDSPHCSKGIGSGAALRSRAPSEGWLDRSGIE